MNEKLITSLLIEILKKHNYKCDYNEIFQVIDYWHKYKPFPKINYVDPNDFLRSNINFYKMLMEFEQLIQN